MEKHEHSFWKNRWKSGETGWHQTEVEPELIANFTDLAPTLVLVPLCGKTLDMAWLMTQGHQVVGVELSELACTQFFEENKIPFTVIWSNGFQIYQGEKITLYCGDFFKFTAIHLKSLGELGAVYDRAALIALPPDLRPLYALHLASLIDQCVGTGDFRFLQIILEAVPGDLVGPPFSITHEQFESYYQKSFVIRLLKEEAVEGRADRKFVQSVYCLELRK